MKFSKELMKGTAEFVILKALGEEREAYGYQLIKTITSLSENLFEFQEGTLYPILYRLEEKGYIESTEKKAPNNKMRIYYTLTQKGLGLLADKSREMEFFMEGMKKFLA
jgi:PadR family transcriptional regulator PadR